MIKGAEIAGNQVGDGWRPFVLVEKPEEVATVSINRYPFALTDYTKIG
jgi:hypothetical protein